MRQGWETSQIDDVAKIINGGTPKSNVAEFWDGDVLWITPKDMGKLTDVYVGDTSRKITEAGLAKSSAKIIPANSVILSTRAPIGHLAINTEPMATNQGCRGLVPSGRMLTKFLFYFLSANVRRLDDLGTGTTFKELAKSALAGVEIPLPPLPEQRRIVAILDEAFQGIDRAVANTEKNLANARELFESYLDAAMAPNQSNAKIGKLGEVAGRVDTGPFGSLLHKSDYVEGGTPIINPANILDGEIVADPSKTIDQTAVNRLRSYILKDGDVIIGRRGEIGRCSAVTSNEAGWLCGTGCFVIRTNHNTHPSYLAHLLRCSFYKRKLEAAATGATMLNLSNKAISALQIELPSPDQQQTIVITLASVMERTKTLEQIYHSKIVSLAGLKQSILHKAFAGELPADRAEPVLAKAGA